MLDMWKDVFEGMDTFDEGWRSELPEPAEPSSLAEIEKLVGHSLPDEFKEFYLTHDGTGDIFILEPFMSLADITSAWNTWASIADSPEDNQVLSECCSSHPAGAVKPIYANRGWLPFFGDVQYFVAFDFDPGPLGAVGQIISAGRDDERFVVAGVAVQSVKLTFRHFAEFGSIHRAWTRLRH